jgi:hypothetical protein
MKKLPILEVLCTAAVVGCAAIWFTTGTNVLRPFAFWSLILVALLANRIKFRFMGWVQLSVVLAIVFTNTISWRSGNQSGLQYAALMIIFLGGVTWMHLALLAEEDEDDENEEFEQNIRQVSPEAAPSASPDEPSM